MNLEFSFTEIAQTRSQVGQECFLVLGKVGETLM